MERRTLDEIYDAIALEKANMSLLNSWFTDKANPGSVLDDHQTLLQDLTSWSKVAIWRLIIWIVAVAIWIHEGMWFTFKGEVESDLDKHIAHTARWYQEEALKFQYGDSLVWNLAKRTYEYLIFDETKRIIARAATEEGLGVVAIKVATLETGNLGALSAAQMAAFQAYCAKFKDAGVVLNVISEPADKLKLGYDIYFDPLVLNENGELLTDTSISPVEVAINNYIDTLDFNGRFSLEKCDNAVRNAEGVIDFERPFAQSKYGTNEYSDISVSRVAYAGYFIVDPDESLYDNINYSADV